MLLSISIVLIHEKIQIENMLPSFLPPSLPLSLPSYHVFSLCTRFYLLGSFNILPCIEKVTEIR